MATEIVGKEARLFCSRNHALSSRSFSLPQYGVFVIVWSLDILDRWALNSMDHEGKNYWDSTIKCAKDLLVDAGGVIPGVDRNHTGVGNVVRVVDVMEEVSLTVVAAVVMPILSTTELLAAVRDT